MVLFIRISTFCLYWGLPSLRNYQICLGGTVKQDVALDGEPLSSV